MRIFFYAELLGIASSVVRHLCQGSQSSCICQLKNGCHSSKTAAKSASCCCLACLPIMYKLLVSRQSCCHQRPSTSAISCHTAHPMTAKLMCIAIAFKSVSEWHGEETLKWNTHNHRHYMAPAGVCIPEASSGACTDPPDKSRGASRMDRKPSPTSLVSD